MTRLITTILAALIALTAAPALAASDDMEMVGYVNRSGDTFILLARKEMDNATQAGMMVRAMDADMIEEFLDVRVLESRDLDRTQLLGIGADRATIHAVMDDSFTPGLLVVAADDADVYIFVMMGDDLDGELFAEITRDAIANDLDITTPPGFTEVPMGQEPNRL